jgi:hypothetical protein
MSLIQPLQALGVHPEEAAMIREMSRFNETARSHMQRDSEAGSRWVCDCLACREVRSLVGMEKVLDVWSMVRELRGAEDQFEHLPEGPEKTSARDRYLSLYDELAARVAG